MVDDEGVELRPAERLLLGYVVQLLGAGPGSSGDHHGPPEEGDVRRPTADALDAGLAVLLHVVTSNLALNASESPYGEDETEPGDSGVVKGRGGSKRAVYCRSSCVPSTQHAADATVFQSPL